MIDIIITSAIVMLLLDSVYLSSSSNFFNKIVKNIQGSNLNLNIYGAILCYLLLIFGINYFILLNKSLNYKKKLLNSFVLGIVIYGVFEATNICIFNKWQWDAVVLDTLWGGILFLLTTLITINLLKIIRKKLNIKSISL